MPEYVQGPGAPAQSAQTTAENAQIDARLELAAKKAALRTLEAQAAGVGAEEGGGLPAPPAPPGGRRNTVIIEQDGKTTVLENPTAQQLSQVGIGTQQSPWNPFSGMEGGQKMTLITFALATVLGVTWILAHFLRRGQAAPADTRELNARMSRLESAIETVAIEVERVSESQRYTARIISEGAAQPVAPAAHGERVMRSNGEG